MNEIVRTKTKATGGITSTEREAMKLISDKWIKIALRTEPTNIEQVTKDICNLYAAANLKKPRVVLVSSPIVMVYAYGAAAAIWHQRKNNATNNATDSATRNTTINAIRIATDDATRNAVNNMTGSVTSNAIDAVTSDVTRNATRNATLDATDAATDYATRNAAYKAAYNATDMAAYNATFNATFNATLNAIRYATNAATLNAIHYATNNATDSATRNTTINATLNTTLKAINNATLNATSNAINNATLNATSKAIYDWTDAAKKACYEIGGEVGLMYAKKWSYSYQGGAYWAGICSYIEAMRDVIGLDLPEFKKYQAWEDAAKSGTFRMMHEEFCIVCDFPEVLKIDTDNQAHCENGPSHRWRDGYELYYWHGINVPKEWIMTPDKVDPADIIKCVDVEKRAAGAAIIGWPRMLKVLKYKVIDDSGSHDIGQLIELSLPGLSKPGRFLKAECPRNGTICEGVPYTSDIDNLPIETALHAQAWRIGDPLSDYQQPTQRT
jgi:hypothetical protein